MDTISVIVHGPPPVSLQHKLTHKDYSPAPVVQCREKVTRLASIKDALYEPVCHHPAKPYTRVIDDAGCNSGFLFVCCFGECFVEHADLCFTGVSARCFFCENGLPGKRKCEFCLFLILDVKIEPIL